MPFKSQAQRRKFAQLMVQGKISPETFEEWNRETGSAKLPEHASKRAGKTAGKRRSTKKRPARKAARKKTARPRKGAAAKKRSR